MLTARRARFVLAGSLIATVVAAAAQSRAPGAFGVGVLRRDGVIVPFADFDGKKWRSNWPEPKDQVDVPIHVRDVPSRWWGKAGPHDIWQVWVPSEPAHVVRVQQPDWIPSNAGSRSVCGPTIVRASPRPVPARSRFRK